MFADVNIWDEVPAAMNISCAAHRRDPPRCSGPRYSGVRAQWPTRAAPSKMDVEAAPAGVRLAIPAGRLDTDIPVPAGRPHHQTGADPQSGTPLAHPVQTTATPLTRLGSDREG